ncbi:hypothetical protein B9Q03_02935 [Candidatus Marsarchaeota G2 archaeon OSP_D]|uniref:Uncharacterized protein n=2 Tax=Candidatus Marsarchaeota group 2 TaxID=2203771 RepID=A0A2R6AXN1_9ARCH|nr:MAG: hypothetical protein B9Q08_03495 [Candidatus Marsarchaeota G2 archaeon ECH_B_SAG-M15]PSN91889.1 MAG: hypothetical protein B9Q03_02935 [Candidatus Marsarchaeota G2 archaeon OSP_D]
MVSTLHEVLPGFGREQSASGWRLDFLPRHEKSGFTPTHPDSDVLGTIESLHLISFLTKGRGFSQIRL